MKILAIAEMFNKSTSQVKKDGLLEAVLRK